MYSNIKKWQIKNFRNLGSVDIDFTKSPIVTLVGDNEAGKTSVVKSFAVLGANGYESDQKSYIRDGSKGFGIAAELEDGTKIVRIKTAGTNSFTIEDADGNTIYSTDKIDRGYGVPVEIAKVMGMLVEPETKELLQVRTYEDQLLFVLTKGSENYKVMYNALKVDNITRAINNGNKQANADRQAITNSEVAIQTLREAIKGIHIVDIGNLTKVRDIIKEQYEHIKGIQRVIELLNRNEEIENNLGSLKELSGAEEINEELVYKLNKVEDNIKNKIECEEKSKKFEDIDKIQSLDINALSTLIRVKSLTDENNEAYKKYESIKEVEGLSEINIRDLNDFESVLNRLTNSNKIEQELGKYVLGEEIPSIALTVEDIVGKINTLMSRDTEIETSIAQFKTEADEWYQKIKESGALVTECPNCGETVVIDQSLN